VALPLSGRDSNVQDMLVKREKQERERGEAYTFVEVGCSGIYSLLHFTTDMLKGAKKC
jgi:hypothetical protein